MMATELPPYTDSGVPRWTDSIEQVMQYHAQTKHSLTRYARALGYLDWANQPDPFRRYLGAVLVPFPLISAADPPVSPPYHALFHRGAVPTQPVSLATVSRFFELALALTAWKKSGDVQWALRSNPSSGNLHPTEAYLVVPQLAGLALAAGLYHYAPKEHGLERRAAYAVEDLRCLLAPFPAQAFLVGLTSIHSRESWKYGERAFRYCNHDVGHALGTLRVAAATLGWNMGLLDGVAQDTVAALFGTDRVSDFTDAEREHPDCVAVVWPSDVLPHAGAAGVPDGLDVATVQRLTTAHWFGHASRLSQAAPVPWPLIDDVAAAGWKPLTASLSRRRAAACGASFEAEMPSAHLLAGQLIRQRRSAVAFDGQTGMTAATFFQMLQRVMPEARVPLGDRPMPWDLLPWQPAIHLLLFVHRVDGIVPGVYVLVRDPEQRPALQQAMHETLQWLAVPDCPATLPLYRLREGNAQRAAVQLSCHQAIAGDSAVSLGMLAEFEGRLRAEGPWCYPRLFWEAGLLGQVLYLEAEAAGIRGTGIGCFFDDSVHALVGIDGQAFQSLYHFTMGGPIEDVRVLTVPPYQHRVPSTSEEY